MFVQLTLWDTDSVISSPESESGASLLEAPDGTTIDPYGLGPAPASPSAEPVKAEEPATSATSGPISSGSSRSAALTSALANRLRARSASLGSTMCRLTWKERATPLGRSIPALRASALPTGGRDCTGWPTPITNDRTGSTHCYSQGNKTKIVLKLPGAAKLTGWPTPCTQDGPNGGPSQGIDRLPGAAPLACWPTPMAGSPATETYNRAGNNDYSRRATELCQVEGPARLTALGEMLTGSTAGMESGGQLSHRHSLWLQGIPVEAWRRALERSVSKARETPSARRKPKRS